VSEYPMMTVNSPLAKRDIIGHRIARVWQTITMNPGDMDFAAHVFELTTGNAFRLPFDREEQLSTVEIPPSAVSFDLPSIAQIRESEIADICCPEDDEWVNCQSMCILLKSGLWISEIVGAPHGVMGIGLFVSDQCPWQWPEECGLASYFRE
jgi:hypothetical protein